MIVVTEEDVQYELVLNVIKSQYAYKMHISAKHKMISIITKISGRDSGLLDTLLYDTIEDMRRRIWNTALVGFSEHLGNGTVTITKDKLIPVNYKDSSYNTYKLCSKWRELAYEQVTTEISSIDYGRLMRYDSGLCTIIDSLINGHSITFQIDDFIGAGRYDS